MRNDGTVMAPNNAVMWWCYGAEQGQGSPAYKQETTRLGISVQYSPGAVLADSLQSVCRSERKAGREAGKGK